MKVYVLVTDENRYVDVFADRDEAVAEGRANYPGGDVLEEEVDHGE